MCAGKGLLAVQENFGHVAECGCGTLHVTVGPVSVALDAKALRRLHELLAAAIERLDSEGEELAQPKPLVMHSSHLALRKVLRIKH
jgi:uncharacterized protein YunC (DUF1805 family)